MARLRFITAVLGVAVLTATAYNAEPRPKATIIEYGRYTITVTGAKPAKNTSGGVVLEKEKVYKHIETTKVIPRNIGETFGYRCKWENLPLAKGYELKTEMHHPPIKQPDGKVLTKSVSKEMVKPRHAPNDIICWTFLSDYAYELVPGKWTSKVFIDGVEVASMTFEVEK
jgi:hypothetical protein